MGHLWLREETKPHERRTPLLPEQAAVLVRSGHTVVVESSGTRIAPDAEFAAAGCRLEPPGTWVDAPAEFFILGLKELPSANFPLRHSHIYYAHCYKGQDHSRSLLRRFRDGGGTLLDCEYLTDDNGFALTVGRIGWLSGFVGAALAVQFVFDKALHRALEIPHPYFPDRQSLVARVVESAREADFRPSVVIIGHRGNAGSGASELCREVGIVPTRWGRAETADPDILATLPQFDVLVNCIQSDTAGSPFLQEGDLSAESRLSILADVTCDVGSPAHRFPLYSQVTTIDQPVIQVGPAGSVDVISIDHLTTLVPAEASRLIAEPLFPQLQALLDTGESALPGPWRNTRQTFLEVMRNLC